MSRRRKTWACHAGPMVRIRLPPAASLQQTVPALGFEAPERSCGVSIRSQVQVRSATTLGRPALIRMGTIGLRTGIASLVVYFKSASSMLFADIAASLRCLVAQPTVEQHAQRGDEGERLV